MDDQNVSIGTNAKGSTAGIRKVVATQQLRPEKCEIAIHIGVFFDGTGNARDGNGNPDPQWQHKAGRKHSNVARLFDAYPDDKLVGSFPMYVPGLGTPFPDIGEDEPAVFGNAAGEGGDGRVNYGLLHVFNAAHRAISPSNRPLFEGDVVKALCRNGIRGRHVDAAGQVHYDGLAEKGDAVALKRVDMDTVGGLLMNIAGGRLHAETFYKAQSARLANLIAHVADKPRLKEIFIDVFGFSRGASEARAFCNWLDKLFVGRRLFGVVAQIRFLGIFDTVASVGSNSAFFGNGHMSWADAPYLRIPPRVRHCEHYVAMHENRPSFPVEYVENEGVLAPNCRQFAYPGVHSDVGGGYLPDEQGRWISETNFEDHRASRDMPARDEDPVWGLLDLQSTPSEKKPDINDLDSRKLSQIALNHMYRAAKAANVPLDKVLARAQGGYDSFAIHPLSQRVFDEFMAMAGGARRQRDWLIPCLAWRYQVRNDYGSLDTTLRASPKDRDDLQGANRTLLLDIDALEDAGSWQRTKDRMTEPLRSVFDDPMSRATQLAPEAGEVLSRMKAQGTTPTPMARLFRYLCHDSYAGFRPFDAVRPLGIDIIPGSWEAQGYLRYRRRYEGNDRQLTRIDRASQNAVEAVG
jgi:hypothetical protein